MRFGTVMALCLLLLSACQVRSGDEPPSPLLSKVKLYEDVVRWRDLRKMYLFGETQDQWTVEPGLENVKVNGYDAGRLLKADEWRWQQSVSISYVLVDRQVVKQIVDQQFWVSKDEGETWFRENAPPRFLSPRQ